MCIHREQKSNPEMSGLRIYSTEIFRYLLILFFYYSSFCCIYVKNIYSRQEFDPEISGLKIGIAEVFGTNKILTFSYVFLFSLHLLKLKKVKVNV